jgi:hypothetical protein
MAAKKGKWKRLVDISLLCEGKKVGEPIATIAKL